MKITKKAKRVLSQFTLLLSVSVLLSPAPVFAEEEQDLQIFLRKGKLSVVEDDDFNELEEGQLPESTGKLAVGDQTDASELLEKPDLLKEASLVISYSKSLMATLANGSIIERKIAEDEEGPEQLSLSGVAHLLVLPQEEKENQLVLNNLQLTTQSVRLFVNTLGENAELTIVEGDVNLTFPPGIKEKTPAADGTSDVAKADSTQDAEVAEKEVEVTNEPVILELSGPVKVIIGEKEYELVKEIKPEDDQIFSASLISGFETLGTYVKAGTVGFEEESLEIVRNEKSASLDTSPATVFVGDQVKTAGGQTVVINLLAKDDIRLGPNSSFTIEEYAIEEEKNIFFSFIGKIRARIAKRKKLGILKFKTVTAVIGVKGTDFEALASEASSEVATIEGSVGVADAAGQGEVLVEAGMMTTVEAGALPTQPQPIPPERLQELNSEGIPIDEANIIQPEEIKFVTPQEGKSYSDIVIALELTPEDATIEFLVDEQIQILQNGSPLKNLAEGPHKLTVKGIGEDALSKTVSFTIDKTKPALVPENQLEGILLRQGFPLSMTWSEGLESVSVASGATSLELKADKENKTFEIDASPLFANLQEITKSTLKIVAKDLAGNETQLERTLELKPKPLTPPILRIGDGLPSILTNSVKAISINSDREVEKWQVFLDKKPLTLPSAPAKEGAEKPSKTSLVLPDTLFTNLTEGKHELVVSGIDDFELMGSQKLDIEIDKTLPTIADPVTLANALNAVNEKRNTSFANLGIKEGETVHFVWSEDVLEVELQVGQMKMQLLPSPDKKSHVLTAEQTKQLFGKLNSSVVQLRAKDKAGNTNEIQGTITYKARPSVPPRIVIGRGEQTINTNKLTNLKIEADRELFQWNVVLNGQALQLMTDEEKKSKLPAKSVEVPTSALSALKDGKHQLTVNGSDAFNMNSSQKVTINLDQKQPKMVFISDSAKPEEISLNIRQTIDVEWSEPVNKVKSTLKGKPWDLKLSSDRKRLFIYGNPDILSFTPKDYKIEVFDSVGNSTIMAGNISLRKPRVQALFENHRNSVLSKTSDPVDETMLTQRPKFQMNNSTPLNTGNASGSGPQFESKPNTPKELIQKLDDPSLNLMSDF